MDPIHPINPVTRGIGPVAPLTSTRRIESKPRREPERDPRRKHEADYGADGADPDEGDSTPHVDIKA
jgi:hypothetical protein